METLIDGRMGGHRNRLIDLVSLKVCFFSACAIKLSMFLINKGWYDLFFVLRLDVRLTF